MRVFKATILFFVFFSVNLFAADWTIRIEAEGNVYADSTRLGLFIKNISSSVNDRLMNPQVGFSNFSVYEDSTTVTRYKIEMSINGTVRKTVLSTSASQNIYQLTNAIEAYFKSTFKNNGNLFIVLTKRTQW